jgi:hypothetical protein
MKRLVKLRRLLNGKRPAIDAAATPSAPIGLLIETIRLEERTASEELSALIEAFRRGE